ncbi:arylsulfatase [Arcticibacter tournemirensis]|uniref:Arylsulfatase n=1 Tax=Arcticibacter tournemirensis TaxID=699437 RepID=A0A5M9HC10_9SPHI|nr:arylsulfatase [Arcticibacter tournemirensis]KAA8482844.1 arylsulfatase [Arcticibacter tournemirensis]TQM49779.1 arylsulfatase [Arcticibacter tournemirensis]
MKYIKLLVTSIVAIFSSASMAQKKPNIIVILADDMGFSDIGSYGGEIQTPNIDKLASEGIRYKQFYNAARCCPTRASLVTGLYPHQAGMGWMAAADLGTPEYQGTINNKCVTIAEVLKTAGYSTYMTGKWHLTNERKIDGMVTDSWPMQRGFDHYFGIIPGGANYYTPTLYSNNRKYPAPANFYLTTAISDTSVKYIDQHFSQKGTEPMFMYVAYTSPHWPLHALQKDIDKYKDLYKAGWDKMRRSRFERQKELGLMPKDAVMSPRDEKIEAWDSLSEEKKNEMAMRMAIYAAQIDVMDNGIGKIVQKLKEKNQLDNTLIFFLSDNGACAEFISSGKSKEVDGREDTFESYRINWANVSSTPFKEYKHFTHEGGIATPLIVHWPKGIASSLNNKFVGEYGHLTDIMATCVDVAQASYPSKFRGNAIIPMQGKSLVPHFSGKSNNRGVIYWEHEANIAVRDGKWKLVAKTAENEELSKDALELYDMNADPVEMHNLASKYPERVSSLYEGWLKWARSINAFPLDTREYNIRAQEYRKQVNGSFDDNLGGWTVKKNQALRGSIDVDTTSQISGKNSARISVTEPGERLAALSMNWRFASKKGEKYMIRLKTKAAGNSSYILRLEKPSGEAKLIDQVINASDKVVSMNTGVVEVSENGPYQLSLYFGKLNRGDVIWVDDIDLIKLRN